MTCNQLRQIQTWVGWVIFIGVAFVADVVTGPKYGPLCVPYGIALAFVIRFLVWPVVIMLIALSYHLKDEENDQDAPEQKH